MRKIELHDIIDISKEVIVTYKDKNYKMEEKYTHNVSRLRRENCDLKKGTSSVREETCQYRGYFSKMPSLNIRPEHIWEVTSGDKNLGLNRIQCITTKRT